LAAPMLAFPRPACPAGHAGRVWLAGSQQRGEGRFDRPRYVCVPADPTVARHRFSDVREQRTMLHPHGVACAECDVRPERHQGHLRAWNWDFAAREVADALTLVGRGLSFRQTGERLRLNAQRFVEDETGLRFASRQATLVARYLDLFGPLVTSAVEHPAWPPIVLLDAVPLRSKVVTQAGRKTTEAAGAFLGATGHSQPHGRPHFWKAAFAGGLDTGSWFEFLRSLPGIPEWVVTDGDEAVRRAVRDAWGDRPVLYSCEGHLWRNYEAAALGDGLSPYELRELWHGAFVDEDGWRAFLVRVLDHPAASSGKVADWIGHNHETILGQIRQRRPGYPRGIGALESSLVRLDRWIGDRRKTFQNVDRLNTTLALMRAEISGCADPARYARLVREAFEATDGRPAVAWRAGMNPKGYRELFAVVDAAQARRRAAFLDLLADSKRRSIERKAAIVNAFHASVGAPPIELVIAPRSASIRVADKTVAVFPLVLREWDATANGGPGDRARAGESKPRAWRCWLHPDGHRWTAPTNQRTGRLTTCPACSKVARKGRRPGKKKADLAEVVDEMPSDVAAVR